MNLLSYIPFFEPLDLHDHWWWTLLPLALFISMAYKAVRVPDLRAYWGQVFLMAAQIVAGMIGLAAAVYVGVELLAPALGG